MILSTTNLCWQVATKTKPLRAKPLVNLLVDRSVLSKFLVDTLEGKEPLKDGAVICIGQSNDAWQQMPSKLLAKYNVTAIDDEGWMICEPRPDNAVDCTQISKDQISDTEPTYIIGNYGETLADGTLNAQLLTAGDYICRDRKDPTDQWVVRRKIFENTYSVK
jgi:hypothetical protein